MTEKKYSSDGFICPYCDDETQAEYEENCYENEVLECDVCGKSYYATTVITFDYRANPDCVLNGGKHVFKPFAAGMECCSECGKWKND